MTQARIWCWRRVVSTIHMRRRTERLAGAARALRVNSPNWMRRRVPTPLMAVLQAAAFPFRHDAVVEAPIRIERM